MISRNDYDSFGEIVSSTGSSQNSITYTGQRLDVESGLMALGNGERYYNPSYGRFIQQDSFAGFPQEPQSLNRFSYVINNPTKHTDPSGHIAPLVVLAVIGVGALIGGGVGAGYSYTKQQAEIADGTRKAADFSYTEIAKSAGLGALFGGAAAGIATVGTLAAAAVIGGGAVMSGVQVYQGYVDYQNGNEYSGKTDMAFGVAGVLLSFLGAKSLAGRSNTRVIQENVNKTTPKLQKQLGDGGVQQRISKGRLLNAAPEEIVNPPKKTRFIADENGGMSDVKTGSRGNFNKTPKKKLYGDDEGLIFEGKTETNYRNGNVVMPKNQIIDSPDLPNSARPIFREGPFTEAQMLKFKKGNSAGTKLSPHHRHQLPKKFGGVIDEIPGFGHPEGNIHTSSVRRHHNPSIFSKMRKGENLRQKEIRDFWKTKGRRLRQVGEDQYIDPGFEE